MNSVLYVANTFLATSYDVIKLNALDEVSLSKHLNELQVAD
jgi:hypothetical protein